MSGFSEILMSHFTEPSNRRAMAEPNAVGQASLNEQPPFISIFLRVSDEIVRDAAFEAAGCGVTIAACSMLTELVIGSSIEDCRTLSEDKLIDALGGVPEHKHYCVHLTMQALRNALAQFRSF